MVSGCSINECATLLGLTARQVSHAVDSGAPTLRRGGKGRGRSTLVDAAAISRWFEERGTFSSLYLRRLADGVTNALARSTIAAFRAASGPHKFLLGAGHLKIFVESDAAMRAQLGLPALRPDEWPDDIQQMHTAVSIFG